MGGYDKKLDYDKIASELIKKADNVVLTGQSAPIIKKAIEKYISEDCGCRIYYEAKFENAVMKAAFVTPEGGKVLLSPASASFDEFNDFEERGNMFKIIVNSL